MPANVHAAQFARGPGCGLPAPSLYQCARASAGRSAGDRARRGPYVFDARASAISRRWPGCGASGSASTRSGWSRPPHKQMRRCPTIIRSPPNRTSPSIDLAEKLVAHRAGPMSKVFFTNSGSEANDTVVKLVWYYNNALGRPQQKKIISRDARLSRRHHRLGQPDRPAEQPPRLRPAARQHPAHGLPALLPLRPPRRERGGVRHAPGRGARGADPEARGRTRSRPSSASR